MQTISGGWKMGALHGGHQGEAWQSQPTPPPAQVGQLCTQGSSSPDHQAHPGGLGRAMGLRVGPAWQGPCPGRAWGGTWRPALLWYLWEEADGSRGLMWGPGLWAWWGKLQGLGRDNQVCGGSQGNENINCKCSLSRWKKEISNLGYDIFR